MWAGVYSCPYFILGICKTNALKARWDRTPRDFYLEFFKGFQGIN